MSIPKGHFVEGFEFDPDSGFFLLNRNGSADFASPDIDTSSSFTRYTSDYRTAPACWQLTGRLNPWGEDFIPIDYLNDTYHLEAYFKSIGTGGLSRLYFGFVPYDGQQRRIYAYHNLVYTATQTRLAQDLNNGDTKIYLNDTSSWQTSAAPSYRRYIGISPYETYPEYTYTRNTLVYASKDDTENSLTLSSTYSSTTISAGTAVQNHRSGGAYIYAAAGNVYVPSSWTKYDCDIGPGWYMNGGNTKWWYGTEYVRLLWLGNYQQDNTYSFLMDDLKFYNTTDKTQVYVDNSKMMSINTSGSVECNDIYEYNTLPLQINWTTWTEGTSGSQTGFNAIGSYATNGIVSYPDPWGKEIPLWKSRRYGTSNPDGGWNSSVFSGVDVTQTYRWCVWLKRINNRTDGSAYLGLRGYDPISNIGVLNRDNGNVNANPYFWSGDLSALDTWYLIVGHVHPSGSGTGDEHEDSGFYLAGSTTKVRTIARDFVWQETNTRTMHRSYQYYCNLDNTVQYYCYPRIDVCDGTEPTITELVSGIDSQTHDFIRSVDGGNTTMSISPSGDLYCHEINEVGPVDDIVGWWKLDGNAIDYSGNGNDGTLQGSPPTSAGIINNGYRIKDITTYIDLPNDVGYTTEFSVFAWFKEIGTPGGNYHIIFGGQELEISIPTASGAIRCGVYTSSGRSVSNHGSGLLDGNWHHIGFTFNGSTKNAYIDGDYVGQQTGITGTLTYSFSNRRIGRFGSNATYWANGIVDDVRLYSSVLSAADIKNLYKLGNTNTRIINTDGGILYTKH